MNSSFIFSLLALVFSVFSFAFSAWNAFSNSREHKGMILYSDTASNEAFKKAKDEFNKAIGEVIADFGARINNLESGVTPDYEKAKSAADAVNDFHMGLSAILGYDPVKALQMARDESTGEQE